MLAQEAFDKVYTHFIINEGLPSVTLEDPTCRLKLNPNDPDSPRCAVGIFVENYNYELEGYTPDFLVQNGTIPKIEEDDDNALFWARLQACHDLATNRSDRSLANFHSYIKENLVTLAKRFNLQCPEPVA